MTLFRFGGLNLVLSVSRPESEPLNTEELLADDTALPIEFIRLGENTEPGPNIEFPGRIGAEFGLRSTMGRVGRVDEPFTGSVWIRLGLGAGAFRSGRSWGMVAGSEPGGLTVSAGEVSGGAVWPSESSSIECPTGKTPSEGVMFEGSSTP
jgi:hypothetical protein